MIGSITRSLTAAFRTIPRPNVPKAPKGAAHDKAIVLCCDNGFLKYAAFVIQQIYDQNPDPDFDVCLCSLEDLELPPTLAHLPVRILKLDVADALDQAPIRGRFTLAAYLRLALPDFFQHQYRRLLYLDCDLILRPAALSRLIDVPLHRRHPLAAARGLRHRINLQKQSPEFQKLGYEPAPYFNSGVMVIDTRRWVKQRVFGKCLRVIRDHPDVLTMFDQSALNIVLRGNWTEISGVWNWLYSKRHRYLAEFTDPYILHFAGDFKPWQSGDPRVPQQYARAYREFFQRHFPDAFKDMSPDVSFTNAAAYHRECLDLQIEGFPGLLRYMERFDHPLHTLDPD